MTEFLDDHGIIPACAGSTTFHNIHRYPVRDHPRMRGVHIKSHTMYSIPLGSSPHARGPPKGGMSYVLCSRIIPACAGSTVSVRCDPNAQEDHPRMRGVHCRSAAARLRCRGSSPHARGPPSTKTFIQCSVRIILACAGSTSDFQTHPWRHRDHPRMRGVHSTPAS